MRLPWWRRRLRMMNPPQGAPTRTPQHVRTVRAERDARLRARIAARKRGS